MFVVSVEKGCSTANTCVYVGTVVQFIKHIVQNIDPANDRNQYTGFLFILPKFFRTKLVTILKEPDGRNEGIYYSILLIIC
jgi:hypothetical protein